MTRAEDGYTLLELLVAVAIIALFATPMALSIDFGINTWRFTHDTLSQQERDFLVRDRLSDWLAASYPHDVNRRTDVRAYPMSGSRTNLSFVSAIHPDPRLNSMFDVALALDGEKLALDIMPDHLSGSGAETDRTVLVEGVSSVEFSYLDVETDPNNPAWIEDWEGRFNLPAAVKVTLEFNDSKRLWPDLVVGLAVDEWSHCAFDEVSRKCRTGEDAG